MTEINQKPKATNNPQHSALQLPKRNPDIEVVKLDRSEHAAKILKDPERKLSEAGAKRLREIADLV